MAMKLEGYPRGWFVVGVASEVKPGDVVSMKYFGRKLVMFRGEDGEIRILDAYCPHLGADLGVGGKVVDNTIRCPFHAWRFDGKGACVEVPYAKKIPPKAGVRSWLSRERNGFIFMWHDQAGGDPDYEIPLIEEVGDPEWSEWAVKKLTIKTHPREIVENVADKGHFPEVHGTHVDTFENEFIDHIAIQRTEGIAYPRGGGSDKFKLTATYFGPGYQLTEMDSTLPNKLLNTHTPIDLGSVHMRFAVMLKKVGDAAKTEAYCQGYIKNLQIGFEEDIQIWENKKWRDRPVLCDGDGPIMKLRKWYAQFYQERA